MYFQKTKVRFLHRNSMSSVKVLARVDVLNSSFQVQNMRERSLRAAAEMATSEVDGSVLRAGGSVARDCGINADTASFFC